MGVCSRYTRSSEEADEVLNDGFLKAFSNIDTYTPGYSFKGWLRRIMVNASIDHFRKHEKHYNDVDISYIRNHQVTPEVLSQMNEKVIMQALQDLAPSYRVVFNLHVIDGYTHNEIAKVLGISEGTSRSNLNLARAKLQRALSHEFERKIVRNG